MKLIQISGTGGSGKTTVMKKIMADFGPDGYWDPIFEPEPFDYPTRTKGLAHYEPKPRRDGTPKLFGHLVFGGEVVGDAPDEKLIVIGAYADGQCGGCDQISSPDLVYALARRAAARWPEARAVILEGLIMSKSSPERPLSWLAENGPGSWVLIQLETPPEAALESMNRRRAEAGKAPFSKEDKAWGNIVNSWETTQSVTRRMKERGDVHVYVVDRDVAPVLALEEIWLPPRPVPWHAGDPRVGPLIPPPPPSAPSAGAEVAPAPEPEERNLAPLSPPPTFGRQGRLF